jgi:type III restriction enzyme
MKFKFKTQEYQQDAVRNICKVFQGQPFLNMVKYTRDLGIKKKQESNQANLFEQIDAFDKNDDGFENAKIILNDVQLFQNIQALQKDSNYKLSEELVGGLGRCSLDIEMETGTGKTYVYIKSIFELNERYGWSKFIIIVPSIAIREGVRKSFEMMEEHFMEQYKKKIRYFIYNSKRLSELDNFASSSDIQVMIINVQAFNARGADARRIDMVLDEFQSRRPIEVVAKSRPILILDEPQKMGGEATQTSLKKFNPLFNMNFSATHKKHNNLVYSLDALDAYNKKLVKKIQVKGFEIKNLRGTNGYLYLQDIILSKNKPPMAKLEFEISYNKSINRETRLLNAEDNLYHKSLEMEQYKNGYTISEINPFTNSITFLNGQTFGIGEVIGNISDKDLRRVQIRETIISHFQKEEILFNKGIKCLSLFFIDEVKKYRDYDDPQDYGEYAKMFEQEYIKVLNEYMSLIETHYIKFLKNINVKDTHKGYFSIDKKSNRFIDPTSKKKSEDSDDEDAYDLILKDKERLLSFEEPTRFIFSHSALREGWDNPNVFQICALKPGGDSAVAKRQEVGRGLRISVNKVGERTDLHYCSVTGNDFHKINMLTVIATDNYKNFVSDIQKDIKANLADRPTRATIEFFKGKLITDGVEKMVVDSTMASDIQSYLRFSHYVDKENKLTEVYFADKENGVLKEMPDILAPYAESIHKLVEGIFDEKVLEGMIENANQTKVIDNALNDNFAKKEFQTLWNYINHKYTYKVNFSSDELIANAIKHINDKLFVSELKYTVTIGEQKKSIDEHQLALGESFGTIKTRTEKVLSSFDEGIKYDLIGKLVDGTTLTRRTIVTILKNIHLEKFYMFKSNPEEFISKVSKLINEQKASMIVDHVTYDMTDGTYDTNIFTANQQNIDFDKAFNAKKAIQDYIVTDGSSEKSVERKFAQELDAAHEVCVYAKLPRSFQIPTPVGNYAPDWAIAFNDNMGIKHIYFVAETKGTMSSLELRPIEQAKIKCARKLFNELSTNNVRYHDVTSYDDLLNVMKSIN